MRKILLTGALGLMLAQGALAAPAESPKPLITPEAAQKAMQERQAQAQVSPDTVIPLTAAELDAIIQAAVAQERARGPMTKVQSILRPPPPAESTPSTPPAEASKP